ncbi:hypothetical protein PInf_019196 [Phytophthora infestans]|nr:hypothetical protein PInf_019196 [Phytophthora infestans]
MVDRYARLRDAIRQVEAVYQVTCPTKTLVTLDYLRVSGKIIGSGDTLTITEARAVKCFEVASDTKGDG